MKGDTSVRDLMTTDVATLGRNENLLIADDVMRLGRIRHMPVVEEDGTVVGIVSQRDLFRGALARSLGYGERAQQKLMDQLRVKDVMTNDPVTIEPDAPISRAAATMLEKKLGCLLVVEKGQLVGILAESDFVRAYVGAVGD